MKIKNQLAETENFAEELENKLSEEFNHELRYLDVYEINDLNKFTLNYEVKGGYDRSCNAYWGSMEYVEDIVDYIKGMDQVKNVEYDHDEEDLSGFITVEVWIKYFSFLLFFYIINHKLYILVFIRYIIISGMKN